MAQQFPDHHTTSVSVKTQETVVQTDVRFDSTYLRTRDGILKISQLILNLLGFISIVSINGNLYSRGSFFTTVSMLGFWFTGILLVLYLFHIPEKFYKIPWVKIEFFFCIVMVVLYLIASSLLVNIGIEGFVVAGVFGFCAMVAYGVDAFLKFTLYKSRGLTQGERTTTRQTTTVTATY